MIGSGTIQGFVQALQVIETEAFTPEFHTAVHHDLIDQGLATAGRKYIVRITLTNKCEQCLTGVGLLGVAGIGLRLDEQHLSRTHQGHVADAECHVGYPEFPVHEGEPRSIRIQRNGELGVGSRRVPQLLADIRIGYQVKKFAVDGLGIRPNIGGVEVAGHICEEGVEVSGLILLLAVTPDPFRIGVVVEPFHVLGGAHQRETLTCFGCLLRRHSPVLLGECNACLEALGHIDVDMGTVTAGRPEQCDGIVNVLVDLGIDLRYGYPGRCLEGRCDLHRQSQSIVGLCLVETLSKQLDHHEVCP